MLNIYFSNKIKDEKIGYSTLILVRGAVRTTLITEGYKGDAEVSVTFCNDEYIRELNRKFRDIDSSTDVLSFPLNDWSGANSDGGALGDIVISLEHARRQAEEYGHSLDREIAFLTAHSMLHLLGYDHELSDEDDRIMRKRQNAVMDRMGLSVKKK